MMKQTHFVANARRRLRSNTAPSFIELVPEEIKSKSSNCGAINNRRSLARTNLVGCCNPVNLSFVRESQKPVNLIFVCISEKPADLLVSRQNSSSPFEFNVSPRTGNSILWTVQTILFGFPEKRWSEFLTSNSCSRIKFWSVQILASGISILVNQIIHFYTS
jgi:hypothetical protein